MYSFKRICRLFALLILNLLPNSTCKKKIASIYRKHLFLSITICNYYKQVKIFCLLASLLQETHRNANNREMKDGDNY